jgi:hypothetical protein
MKRGFEDAILAVLFFLLGVPMAKEDKLEMQEI